jgi:SAM-dependent methyltransferase
MTRLFRRIRKTLQVFGLDLRRMARSLLALPFYIRDFIRLRRQQEGASLRFPFGTPFPCLEDRFAQSGTARGDYFHQDLWVAQRVFADAPQVHLDVGSRIDGFVAHVAAFRQIEVLDIRPLASTVRNIHFTQCDLMGPLPEELLGYCDSVSCLHAIEHFGLGRYGDDVNYDGWAIGIRNLQRILREGGKLYLSVPIGRQRVEFNAHRVFSVSDLLGFLQRDFLLDTFTFVDDNGELHENVEVAGPEAKMSFGCVYGCGIFELRKRANSQA